MNVYKILRSREKICHHKDAVRCRKLHTCVHRLSCTKDNLPIQETFDFKLTSKQVYFAITIPRKLLQNMKGEFNVALPMNHDFAIWLEQQLRNPPQYVNIVTEYTV